ncbi:MAG: putative baseplate assembly protein [Anaerolineae bacterium]|nr:putative baseplate assembly protein [Anaerolineae bacterium]
MANRYVCDNQRRAQIIRNNAAIVVNGIDFLEVLDSEAPDGIPPNDDMRQRTLLVRLLRPVPAGLTADNTRIDGGVRITPVGVDWVVAADATGSLPPGTISADEAAFFASLTDPDHVLLVRTDSSGDFDTYTLRIVASPTDASPFPGFDPILNRIDFSFKVECPDDFDCAPADDCSPEPEETPAIDYLAKDFNSFRQLILDRMAITNPEWQERHLPDVNVALVDLLAYVGDYLSYWQDGVATEAYLETARRRSSVRRHARLLAYPLHDGCNARTWVAFDVDALVDLPAPTALTTAPVRLLTRMPGVPTVLAESDLDDALATFRPIVFELRTSATMRPAHNTIHLHTWGDEACCLPAGATSATLLSSTDAALVLALSEGDVIIFEEVISPETGAAADADPAHRHAVRLTAVEPVDDPVVGVPVVTVTWRDEDALPFSLCVSKRDQNDTLIEQMTVVRGNVALADHGRTLVREPLRHGLAHRVFRPKLSRTGVTRAAPLDPDRPQATILTEPLPGDPEPENYIDATLPAARLLQQTPQAALPVVELEGDGQTWTPRRDLLESDRFAPHFVAELENDGYAYLRFGDGVFGVEPSSNAFTDDDTSVSDPGALYRIGNGTAGNIGADTLHHIITDVAGISAVRNPLPARGGAAPESLDEVKLYAPQAFRRQERAVTSADYAAVTERHPAVQRAAATRRWTGSWHTMFVTVDRQSGLPVDAVFEADCRDHIEPFRLAGHDVEVDAPRFVALDIRMTVCVQPGYFPGNVQQALLRVFSSRTLSDGQRGFFHPDNWTFGQPVYLSDVIATAMNVTGVQWVDILPNPAQPLDRQHRFQRWGRPPNNEVADGKIKMGRLEIARLDNDPSLPENGKVTFFMEGGI